MKNYLMAFLLVVSCMSYAESKEQEKKLDQEKQAFFENYKRGCTNLVNPTKELIEKTNKVCDCAIQKIKVKITDEEFSRILSSTEHSASLAALEKLKKVALECNDGPND